MVTMDLTQQAATLSSSSERHNRTQPVGVIVAAFLVGLDEHFIWAEGILGGVSFDPRRQREVYRGDFEEPREGSLRTSLLLDVDSRDGGTTAEQTRRGKWWRVS